MSDEPRGPRGPATEAIDRLAAAVEEQNDLARERNAILAALLNEQENAHREENKAGVSLSSTETRIDSMKFTLYDQK